MKKILSMILALTMLFSLTMPAMAAEITGESNTDDPTKGDVTASYTPSTTTAEAKWGASKDSLTGSGTLAEAITAATASGSTVQYIQLQSDVTAESGFIINAGEFTIDLNGRTVTSNSYTFDVRNSGTKVTFADSGTTGAVTTGGSTTAAISLISGGEVRITGGSYSGYHALYIQSGTSAAITGGTFTTTGGYAIQNYGTLTISGGTIPSGWWANVFVDGTTTITGGTFTGSGTDGNFYYYSGTLDLSGYSSVDGLKVSQCTGSDLAVSDENIKLPAGYTFVNGSSNAVTTLTSGTVYTIAAASGGEDATAEAKWGASKDSLTNSGTLADAIAAAEADSTVKYIQLQSDVTAESYFMITSGEFTIDLNGHTVTSDSYTFDVRNSGTKVTFADSGTTGAVTSAGSGTAAIYLDNGGEVQITGGSYSGYLALYIQSGSSAAITGGTFTSTSLYTIENYGTLTISGGTIHSGDWANVSVDGTTTITGGDFTGSGIRGNFMYYVGTLDLSGYSNVTGLKVSNRTSGDLAVSDENIKLPAGYTLVDDSNNAVTTLTSGTVYTIAAVSGGEDTTAKITGAAVYVNEVEQAVGNINITAGDTVKVVYKGENFDKLTDAYGYKVGNWGGYLSSGNSSVTVDTENNTAAVSYAASWLTSSNKGEISYTNAGEDKVVTGYTLTYLEKGTELTTIYFKNTAGWTEPCVYFRDSKGHQIGLAELELVGGESDIYSAAVPQSDWVYQVDFFDNVTATHAPVQTIPTDGSNQYNYDTATWTTFTASTPDTNSADIVWGSMAFTYTDGENGAAGAWSNDGSAGAGTVTVTNKGETAITAKVAYTPVEAYAEIEGSFDAASAELAAEGSKTFTLTLENQPAKAITAGTKIGSVTVTIE